MSAENVQLVQRGYEHFARRDYSEAMDVFAEDAVWHPYLGLVGGDVYRGRDAIRWMLDDLNSHLDLVIEPEEYVDLGDEVLVPVSARATGSESGATVDSQWVQLWTVRDGQVTEVRAFPDREAAEAAARSR